MGPLEEGTEALAPSGIVTFLFTDIEGSTRRWELYRDAMQAAVREHDRVLRGAIVAHGGVVFKTIGDAFCAAFPSAEAAIAATLDAQRALAASDFSRVDGISVRMALNSGHSDERDGDYFGPPVNRVARLLSVTHGGQVLLLGSTADLARPNLPSSIALRSLGAHRLKDLEEPQQVFQVDAPGLRRDFAPLRSIKLLNNNLPAEASSFIGRSAESAEAHAAIGHHRLVTLVGPGGIGKTRLALHVAGRVLHDWPDGVWFVALAPIAEGAAVPRAVAEAMDHVLAVGEDGLDALAAAIARKRMLLVIDNCEHVLDAVAAAVARLLRSCPNVAVLASSRQPLSISGETLLRLRPLDADDANALFAARARASDARFRITDETAPLVARVCRRLDGIPLALELAAARVRLLGPRVLLEKLDDRFRLLKSAGRDADERQRTLQATIDWSYDLLTDLERSLFRRAGVFVDAFSTQAAAAVAARGELDEHDTFEVLSSLEEKSLIAADADSEAPRFRMLESMRAYALERLDETGEHTTTAQRHLAYFRDLAERAEADFMRKGSDSEYTAALAAEVEDIQAALRWSLMGGDVAAGAALITALGRPWARLGLTTDGIARVEAFIAAVPESEPRLLARLYTELAWLAGDALRSTRAYEAGIEAVRWARAANDGATLAWALSYFALVAALTRRFDEARAALAETRSLFAQADAGQRLTELEVRAFVEVQSGDLDAAAAAYEEQLSLLESIGDGYGASNAVTNLAETEHARGNTARAISLVRSVLQSDSVQPGVEQQAGKLANLAAYLSALDETADAKDAARRAVDLLAERDPASAWVTIAAEHFALALALDGDFEGAAQLEGYCQAALEAIGFSREATEQMSNERLMTTLGQALEPARLRALLEKGATLQAADVMERIL